MISEEKLQEWERGYQRLTMPELVAEVRRLQRIEKAARDYLWETQRPGFPDLHPEDRPTSKEQRLIDALESERTTDAR